MVPRQAIGPSALPGGAPSLSLIVGVMDQGIDSDGRVHTDPLPSPLCPRLRINTKLEERTKDGQPNTLRRFESEPSILCDGWCSYNVFAHRTAVSVHSFSCCTGELTFAYQLSLSACSDPQRAREGPRGSLTMVVYRYLGKQRSLQLI